MILRQSKFYIDRKLLKFCSKIFIESILINTQADIKIVSSLESNKIPICRQIPPNNCTFSWRT